MSTNKEAEHGDETDSFTMLSYTAKHATRRDRTISTDSTYHSGDEDKFHEIVATATLAVTGAPQSSATGDVNIPTSMSTTDDQTATPVMFNNVQNNEKDIVDFQKATDEDIFPKLGDAGTLISAVYYLLPHRHIFGSPIHVTIRLDERPEDNTNIVVFYSDTDQNEKPHWDMITKENKACPERCIWNIDYSTCTISMPTLCAICVGELDPGQLELLQEPKNKFDIFVGFLVEGERYNIQNNRNRWLVKVRVLLSRDRFSNPDIRKQDKFEVISHDILGDPQVHILDIKNGWRYDDESPPEVNVEPKTTISVFKLFNKKQKEVVFSFVSDTASETDIFKVTVRLHQDKALMHCELLLTETIIIGNMIQRIPEQGADRYPENFYNGGQYVPN